MLVLLEMPVSIAWSLWQCVCRWLDFFLVATWLLWLGFYDFTVTRSSFFEFWTLPKLWTTVFLHNCRNKAVFLVSIHSFLLRFLIIHSFNYLFIYYLRINYDAIFHLVRWCLLSFLFLFLNVFLKYFLFQKNIKLILLKYLLIFSICWWFWYVNMKIIKSYF